MSLLLVLKRHQSATTIHFEQQKVTNQVLQQALQGAISIPNI